MKNHTTFRIGGEADFLALPQTTEEIKSVFALCREEGVPVFVMGNGSNLLASDEGFRGVVIKIAKKMSAIQVDGDMLTVQAGALMSAVGNAAKGRGP